MCARLSGHVMPSCVADMTALPIRSQSLAAIVTLCSVIHLNTPGRAAAYQEFARTLRIGGHALIAFHTSDADVRMGGRRTLTDWWGHQVELVFRFLDPAEETVLLADAGLMLTASLDREPEPGVEHPSGGATCWPAAGNRRGAETLSRATSPPPGTPAPAIAGCSAAGRTPSRTGRTGPGRRSPARRPGIR